MTSNLKKNYDLNVPLSPKLAVTSSSDSFSRKQLAHFYQTRLHQLGYSEIAFSHTTYGRINLKKDDADVTLPWNDIVLYSRPNNQKLSIETINKAVEKESMVSFGRVNSLNMRIYRRLNIVVEEVSDVSRILFSSLASSADIQESSAIRDLLRKYDIISFQPMNELVLQNICELLTSSIASVNSRSYDTIPVPNIDIILLEYATGSKGGYGVPFKLRKEYIVKALEAGVTFEICYASAMVDTKRRQGFLRTLVEFQESYNKIQKKHILLQEQFMHKKIEGQRCKIERFPVLLSSGSRQNYSQGTDEGMLALRNPKDIKFLVDNMVGDGLQHAFFDDMDHSNSNNGKRQTCIINVAEKVLSRARERCSAVVTRQSSSGNQRKRKNGTRANHGIQGYVHGYTLLFSSQKSQDSDGSEADDGLVDVKDVTSVVGWLSASLLNQTEPKYNINNKQENEINFSGNCADTDAELLPEKNLSQSCTTQNVIIDTNEDLADGFLAL